MIRTDGLRLVGKSPARERAAQRAFERHYRASYPLVYNYVCRHVLDWSAAEDVTAEAFMRAARYFDRFDESRAKFSTWVVSIARNCIKDYYAQNHLTVAIDDVAEAAFAIYDEEGEDFADRELLAKLMGTLNGTERDLVYLKYYEGKRNVEIAEELGMNASTVASKLQRALLKMRAVAEGIES